MCERELETGQNCNILTQLYWPSAFLSRSPGLLNRGPGGPASMDVGFLYRILSLSGLVSKLSIGGLRAPSAGCWLSVPHLISTHLIHNSQLGAWWHKLPAGCWLSLLHLVSNWSGLQTNWLPAFTELYYSSTSTFVWTPQSHSFNPSTVKVIFWYSLSRCTCYLHWYISYFDSPAGS